MSMMLAIALSALVGMIVGVSCCETTIRHLRKRLKELRLAKTTENPELAKLSTHEKALYYQMLDSLERGETPIPTPLVKKNILRSVTRFLFITAQVFAIVWVTWSYVLATYSTVVLTQPFPAEELSGEAVRTILGVGVLKVVENIFEHNEGGIFGRTKESEEHQNEAVHRDEAD